MSVRVSVRVRVRVSVSVSVNAGLATSLTVGDSLAYLDDVDPALRHKLDHVIGGLVRLTV